MTTDVLRLAHAITSPSAHVRDEGAAQVVDVLRDLTPEQALVLAHLLVETRLSEGDRCCREQQLHSLLMMNEWHSLPPELLARLRYLPQDSIDEQQADYLDDLLGRR